MYFNRITSVWIVDPLDYFLISAIIASVVASHLKEYLSEKAAMERLKKSIINKSSILSSKTPISNSKDAKIKRIYRLALNHRGGQFNIRGPGDDPNPNFSGGGPGRGGAYLPGDNFNDILNDPR